MAFLYSRWLALPLSTRNAIAKKLGIAKTMPTHVQDNRIVADGYPIHAVEHALEAITDWDALIAEAEGRTPVVPIVETPVEVTGGTNPPPIENVVETNRFCEFCDSKGGRHKKNCTR